MSSSSIFWALSLKRANRLAFALAAISAVGFADAAYLAIEHYRGLPPACLVFTGCETVAQSAWSEIGGVPVALAGAAYYFAVLLLSVLAIERGSKKLLFAAALLTPLGFLASIFFVYLQLFVIGAICLYCIVSAVSSTLLFAISLPALASRAASRTMERSVHGDDQL